MNINVDVKFQY